MTKKEKPQIRNRIVRHEDAKVDQIIFNPKNWRIHPKEQQEGLKGILEEIGWVQEVVINEVTGNLIDGHLRVLLADRKGEKTVPALIVNLSEQEEAEVLATMDPIGAMAATDKNMLDTLLRDVDSRNADVQALLAKIAEKNGLDYGKKELQDANPQENEAAKLNLKWGVKAGDLWRVGSHKLLCGDSTKAEDVKKILKGETPFLMVTDPPYGVDYDPEWRQEAGRNGGGSMGKVTNDNRAKWSQAYVLSGATVAYVWHAARFAAEVSQGLQAAGYDIRSQIIWAKKRFAISRSDYHWAHEPCWYAVKHDCKAHYIGNRKQKTMWADIIDHWSPKDRTYAVQLDEETILAFDAACTTVWEIAQDKAVEGGHSTQKPLECMARPIRNHGMPGDIVYDPFVGSGTTMVACENLRRKCRAVEISPDYCGVVLERMAAAFPVIEIERTGDGK